MTDLLVLAGIGWLLLSLRNLRTLMTTELDTLKTEVSEATTVMASAAALIAGLKAKLDEAIASGDPAQLQALSASLDTSANDLASAIAANTPAAGEPSGEAPAAVASRGKIGTPGKPPRETAV